MAQEDEETEVIYTCPRCHSESIAGRDKEVCLDGVAYGWRSIFACGNCWHEFETPEEVIVRKGRNTTSQSQ